MGGGVTHAACHSSPQLACAVPRFAPGKRPSAGHSGQSIAPLRPQMAALLADASLNVDLAEVRRSAGRHVAFYYELRMGERGMRRRLAQMMGPPPGMAELRDGRGRLVEASSFTRVLVSVSRLVRRNLVRVWATLVTLARLPMRLRDVVVQPLSRFLDEQPLLALTDQKLKVWLWPPVMRDGARIDYYAAADAAPEWLVAQIASHTPVPFAPTSSLAARSSLWA